MSGTYQISGKQAAAVIAAVLAAALLVLALAPSEGDASVGTADVAVYDEESDDYSGLVYMNEELPADVNPLEWAYSDDGYWYYISSSGTAGEVMTYGDAGVDSASTARADLRERLGLSSDAEFTIMQVRFYAEYGSNAVITVEKDGQAVKIGDSYQYTVESCCESTGIPLSAYMQAVCLLSVGTDGVDSTPDIAADSVSGTYDVTVKSGSTTSSAEVFFSRDSATVSGTVKDADENAIEGAVVGYTVTGGSSSTGTVTTGSDGKYSLTVASGSNVTLVSVTATGYTFSGISGPGTVSSDLTVNFTATEHTLPVTVKDKTDRAAADVTVSAFWLIQTANADDPTKYDISTSTDGCTVTGTTDSDGSTSIAYTVPENAKYLYVYGVSSGSIYHFANNLELINGQDGQVGTAKNSPLDISDVNQPGNVCWDPSTDASVALTADDSSFEVTVTDGSGSYPLANIYGTATWYYEYATTDEDGNTTYEITSTGSGVYDSNSYSTASFIGSTDSDGKAYVVWKYSLVPDGWNAYLYVSYTGVNPSTSPRSAFGFTCNGITESTASETSLANFEAADGEALMANGSIAAVLLKSDDEAYEVTGNVTGTTDAVGYVSYTGVTNAMSDTIVPDSDGNFSFYVKSGSGAVLTWGELDGYVFSESTYTFYETNASHDFTVTAAADTFERYAPAELGTYTVSGLEEGAAVTISYTVSGTVYRVSLTCYDGEAIALKILGWSSDEIDAYGNPASDGYETIGSDGNYTLYEKTKVSFVVYNSSDGVPTRQNVATGVSIKVYLDGSSYYTMNTGSDGTTSATLPIGATDHLEYYYGKYSVTNTLTLMTGNIYEGYYALNIYGAETDSVPVSFTVKYVAVSSLENTQPADVQTGIVEDQTVSGYSGNSVTLTAPSISGFTFSGWMVDGTMVSSDTSYSVDLTGMDAKSVTAIYSAESASEDNSVDSTAVALGFAAVVVAILALAFVLLQGRRI
jgi:hypothetical protein